MRYFIYIHTAAMPEHTCTMWEIYGKDEMEKQLRRSIEEIPMGLSATLTVRPAGKRWVQPIHVIQVDTNHSVHIKTKPRR